MNFDLREWLPDFYQYKFTLLYLIGQWLAIARWSSRASHLRPPRSPSDPAWFVPVLIWGVESLHHLAWWLLGTHGFCFGLPVAATLQRAELTTAIMLVTLAACFLSEHKARKGGLAVRAAQATLPLPVLAAVLGVQWTWALCLAVLYVPRS